MICAANGILRLLNAHFWGDEIVKGSKALKGEGIGAVPGSNSENFIVHLLQKIFVIFFNAYYIFFLYFRKFFTLAVLLHGQSIL